MSSEYESTDMDFETDDSNSCVQNQDLQPSTSKQDSSDEMCDHSPKGEEDPLPEEPNVTEEGEAPKSEENPPDNNHKEREKGREREREREPEPDYNYQVVKCLRLANSKMKKHNDDEEIVDVLLDTMYSLMKLL